MSDGLPKGWIEASLDQLLGSEGVLCDGDWVETKDQDPNGDVRLIQLADIGDGEYRDKSERFLTFEASQRLGCTYLNPGDILIARLGEPLGKACIFPGDSKKAITVVDVCIFRSGLEEVDHNCIKYFLCSPQVRQRIATQSSGTTRKRISGKKLRKLPLSVPPFAEQRHIVAKIEELFNQIDEGERNLKRVQELLKRYRQSVLKAAVTGERTKDWRNKNQGKGETGEELLERILKARREA